MKNVKSELRMRRHIVNIFYEVRVQMFYKEILDIVVSRPFFLNPESFYNGIVKETLNDEKC